jgi:hypothetical protein
MGSGAANAAPLNVKKSEFGLYHLVNIDRTA